MIIPNEKPTLKNAGNETTKATMEEATKEIIAKEYSLFFVDRFLS